MSPFKLSLISSANEDPDETVDLDDDLVGRFREVVDASPDLTMGEALRLGVQHVADNGPFGGGQQ